MRLLLDTHIALWLLFDPGSLSSSERALIAQPWDERAYSVVSLWELRVKWDRRFVSGVRKGPLHPAEMLAALESARITLLDLTPAACVTELDPPLDHSDPFDMLLLTQAKHGGYRLLTRDKKLAEHPVALRA